MCIAKLSLEKTKQSIILNKESSMYVSCGIYHHIKEPYLCETVNYDMFA